MVRSGCAMSELEADVLYNTTKYYQVLLRTTNYHSVLIRTTK